MQNLCLQINLFRDGSRIFLSAGFSRLFACAFRGFLSVLFVYAILAAGVHEPGNCLPLSVQSGGFVAGQLSCLAVHGSVTYGMYIRNITDPGGCLMRMLLALCVDVQSFDTAVRLQGGEEIRFKSGFFGIY